MWLTSGKWKFIYAHNIQDIVQIDRETGNVIGVLDLSSLYTSGDVLNGICYDKTTDKIYVTGKYWPKVRFLQLLNELQGLSN